MKELAEVDSGMQLRSAGHFAGEGFLHFDLEQLGLQRFDLAVVGAEGRCLGIDDAVLGLEGGGGCCLVGARWVHSSAPGIKQTPVELSW